MGRGGDDKQEEDKGGEEEKKKSGHGKLGACLEGLKWETLYGKWVWFGPWLVKGVVPMNCTAKFWVYGRRRRCNFANVKYDYDVQRTTTILLSKRRRFDSNSKQPAHYVLDKLIITHDQDPEFLSYHFISSLYSPFN